MATQKKSSTTKTPKTTKVPAATPTPASTPPPTSMVTVTQEPVTPPVTNVANGSNTGTKVELQTSYLAFIAGLLAYYQPDDIFALSSGNVTRDQIIAAFQNFVAAVENTKSSNQAWREDVQAERTLELQVRPMRANVKSIVEGRFNKNGAALLKFGIAPAKTPVKSVATKSAAVAKSEATREARGTKGRVQKLAIKGNVTGVVITPMAAGPSTPATASGGAGAVAPTTASGANGAAAPAATTSPAAAGGTPPHS